jgi:putative transcription factor
MMKARQAKNLTQAQLAQKMNVKPSVITDYEAGKVIPNPQV